MSVYVVTTINWNDPSFWSAISETASGHTLDFSALTSDYAVTTDPATGLITINGPVSSFDIGDATYAGGPDASFGGTTQLGYFTTQIGSAGNDDLSGTAGADTLDGGAGDDILRGGAGGDTLDGGDGSDLFVIEDGFTNGTIIGGELGTDVDKVDLSALTYGITVDYYGDEFGVIEDGTYTISFSEVEQWHLTDHADFFSSGADTLGHTVWAGGGDDIVWAGLGDDTIYGEDGADQIWADAGNDYIDGGAGNDELGGDEGDDTVIGGAGDDYVEGGAGNDALYGGTGNDTIYGKADADTVFIEDNFGIDSVYGGELGVDSDTLDMSALTTGITVTFTGNEAGSFTVGADSVTFFEIEALNLTAQDDTADASLATTSVTIDGGAGSDTITGGSGDDALYGGTGDDTLAGGAGADHLEGGTGMDYADYSDSGAGVSIDLATGVFTGGDAEGDTAIGIDGLIGSDFDDTLIGFDAYGPDSEGALYTNIFFGGAGNDYLDGAGADDTLYGGTGDDTIIGGTGDDVLHGNEGSDTFIIRSDDGNDLIYGGEDAGDADVLSFDEGVTTEGVTLVFGGWEYGTYTFGTATGNFWEIEEVQGTDNADTFDASAELAGVTISAAGGDDVITGGVGDDVMDGGFGSDTFIVNDGWGTDTIWGGDEGGDTDTLDLSNLTVGITVTFSADEIGSATDGTNTVSFNTVESYVLTEQADVFDASGDTAGITVDGGSGGDALTGGSGADTILGGAGEDTLTGGAGDDTLSGGTGDDSFVLSLAGGNDKVTDFDLGDSDLDGFYNDQIDVSDLLNGEGEQVKSWDVTTVDDGFGNAKLIFPGGETLVLEGVSVAQMSTQSQYQAAGIPCFTPGTMVATPEGERAVEDLRPGDLVLTRDNGPKPMLWAARRDLGPADLAARPELCPIRIAPGAFGQPRALIVSPQHGMLLEQSAGAAQGAQSLVRAAQLDRMGGGAVRRMRGARGVSYIHLFFEAHQIVFANDLPSESFYPGPRVLAGFDPAARAEFLALFGAEIAGRSYRAPARAYARQRLLPPHLAALSAPL